MANTCPAHVTLVFMVTNTWCFGDYKCFTFSFILDHGQIKDRSRQNHFIRCTNEAADTQRGPQWACFPVELVQAYFHRVRYYPKTCSRAQLNCRQHSCPLFCSDFPGCLLASGGIRLRLEPGRVHLSNSQTTHALPWAESSLQESSHHAWPPFLAHVSGN